MASWTELSENDLTYLWVRTRIIVVVSVIGGPSRVRWVSVKPKNCPLTDPSPMGRFPQGPVHPAGPLFLRNIERSRCYACFGKSRIVTDRRPSPAPA